MNDKEFKIRIIFLCIICVLVIVCGILIFSNRRTNSDIRRLTQERNEALTKLGETITKLDRANTEFEDYKQTTDSLIQQFNDTIDQSRGIVTLLQNFGNTATGENREIRNDLEGIGQIIEEIKTQKTD